MYGYKSPSGYLPSTLGGKSCSQRISSILSLRIAAKDSAGSIVRSNSLGLQFRFRLVEFLSKKRKSFNDRGFSNLVSRSREMKRTKTFGITNRSHSDKDY